MSSNISDNKDIHAHISPELRHRVEKLRNIGHFGGIISPHRALLTLPMHARELVPALIMALILFLLYVFALDYVFILWSTILEWCSNLFYVDMKQGRFGFDIGTLSIYVPYMQIGAATPSNFQWSIGVLTTAILLIVSFFLPDRLIPFAYLLRALVLIQAISILYFLFFGNYFPYSLAGYQAVMMLAGLFFVGLVPLIYGLIYYIFDETLLNKLWLTLLTMAHLLILIPLQYFAHAYLVNKFSLMYIPVLFLMFGLMINVFVLISFYSWGMSWKGSLHPHARTKEKKSKVEEFAAKETIVKE